MFPRSACAGIITVCRRSQLCLCGCGSSRSTGGPRSLTLRGEVWEGVGAHLGHYTRLECAGEEDSVRHAGQRFGHSVRCGVTGGCRGVPLAGVGKGRVGAEDPLCSDDRRSAVVSPAWAKSLASPAQASPSQQEPKPVQSSQPAQPSLVNQLSLLVQFTSPHPSIRPSIHPNIPLLVCAPTRPRIFQP